MHKSCLGLPLRKDLVTLGSTNINFIVTTIKIIMFSYRLWWKLLIEIWSPTKIDRRLKMKHKNLLYKKINEFLESPSLI